MGRPVYAVPAIYKPLIEAEQLRLGLPSKSETLGTILGGYFAKLAEQFPNEPKVTEQSPALSQPPATHSEEKPNVREVQRYHVIA